MRTILIAAALLALTPVGLAHAAPPDLDEFTVCVEHGWWEVCASRDHTWYCYSVWTGMPPSVSDCFQFIGP